MINDLENLILNKEDEIKKIFYQKINQLNNDLLEKDRNYNEILEKYDKLKLDFKFNFKILEERDSDLKIYEDKIDSFRMILDLKDEEIEKLKNKIDDLSNKLQNEKTKRESNEDVMKFNNTKLVMKHKDEVQSLNSIIEQSKIKLNEMKSTFENEKRKLSDEIERFNYQIKNNSDNEEKNKKEIENLNSSIVKLNNEILNLIREKLQIENKLKYAESLENEKNNLNEKYKFILKENEELKSEINHKTNRNENITKLFEESNLEVHNLKQKIQLKEFELERKSLSEQLINEKIRDCSYHIEKLTEEKRNVIIQLNEEKLKLQSVENKLREEINSTCKLNEDNRKLKENLNFLNENNENINRKFRELTIENEKLKTKDIYKDLKESKESKEDDKDNNSILDFFNTRKNKDQNENLLKEKELEIQRLKCELEGAKSILIKIETEMSQTYNLFKENENKYIEKINKLEVDLIKQNYINKNSMDNSLNKETVKELNEIINTQKKELLKLSATINTKTNEITRIKKERDKLSQLCCSLRAEVNRLENNQIENFEENFNIQNLDIETNRNFNNLENLQNNYTSTNKHLIHSSSSFPIQSPTVDKSKVSEETKIIIENAMNKRDSSIKSNGESSKSKSKSPKYNIRKVQIENLSPPSVSRSKSPKINTNLNDALTITNLKLLKRERDRGNKNQKNH